MIRTIGTLNFQYGGRQNAAGAAEDRLGQLVEIVRAMGEDGAGPDILLAQELLGFERMPWLGAEIEKALGMRCLLSPARYEAHTAVLYRPDRGIVHDTFEVKYAGDLHHGGGVAKLRMEGMNARLAVASAHLSPASVDSAALEIPLLLWRLTRDDDLAVLGGDLNVPPLGDPVNPERPDDPDLRIPQAILDRLPLHNLAARVEPHPEGGYQWKYQAARVLQNARMVDVAARIADEQGRPELRTPTGKGGLRVDQIHGTPRLWPAVEDMQVVRTGEASDHDALVMKINTSGL